MLTLLYFLASTTSWADLLFWLSKVIKSPCSLYLPILCLMQCFPNNQAATAGANIRRSGGLSSLLLPHGFGRPGSQPSSSNPSPSVPAAGNSAQSSFRPGSLPQVDRSLDARGTLTSLLTSQWCLPCGQVPSDPHPSPVLFCPNHIGGGQFKSSAQVAVKLKNHGCEWLKTGFPRCACWWNQWVCYFTW